MDLARRLAQVDGYAVPPRALARFEEAHHTTLDTVQRDALTKATRQWCRLRARAPLTTLCQPSSTVGGLWRLLEEEPGHEAFAAAAFGSRNPRHRSTPTAAPASGSDEAVALHTTYRLACEDEGALYPHLPLLFRVDWVLDSTEARAYVPNCGEVRYCAVGDGTVCLQHLTVRPRRPSRWGGAAAGGIGMTPRDAEAAFVGWGRRGRHPR